jgi:osmoprotectant transport system substrate-binding protein
MIEFRGVSKTYPGSSHPVVNDLSFEILDGEICVLVGPSGCGKTTSMRMVNRLIEPSEGEILIDSEPNMIENYPGLADFKDTVVANDLGLRYQGVENGDVDVGVGFLTDGQLTSSELTVLKDEKNIWPFYYPAPVVRNDVLEANPKMEGILNSVTEKLDVDTIRELNGKVDIDQQDPEDVARDFLQEQGLV